MNYELPDGVDGVLLVDDGNLSKADFDRVYDLATVADWMGFEIEPQNESDPAVFHLTEWTDPD